MGTEDKNPSAASDSRIIEDNPDSYSLNPRLTLVRSLSSIKLRFINYLTKVDDPESNQRFASCNEFTLGINNASAGQGITSSSPNNSKTWINQKKERRPDRSIHHLFCAWMVIFQTNQCKIKLNLFFKNRLNYSSTVLLESLGLGFGQLSKIPGVPTSFRHEFSKKSLNVTKSEKLVKVCLQSS